MESCVLFFVQSFKLYYFFFVLWDVTTNLIITYKNLPLLFALGGCLEEKNRPNQISI